MSLVQVNRELGPCEMIDPDWNYYMGNKSVSSEVKIKHKNEEECNLVDLFEKRKDEL